MFKPKNNLQKFAIGTIFAAVVGFVAGILAAPKSGKETREDLKASTKIAVRQAEKDLKIAHTELQTLVTKAGQLLMAGNRKAKKEVAKAVKRAKSAQNSVREILSAIHEGTADNPELDKALKEANAAKTHLRKYLKSVSTKAKTNPK